MLSPWATFYEIVGSAAGALIGLQFVVIALVANMRRRPDFASINTFSTPTIVHFSGALTISAVMSAPWPSTSAVSVTLAVCGLCGVAYAATVFRHAARQTVYQPVWDDWLWYAIVPCGVYAALTVAALMLLLLPPGGQARLFVVAGAALALLLVGIRNAWDSVTHIVVVGHQYDATTPE